MKWAPLLHFYQPFGQKREIIDKIVAECYRPVGEAILASPRARMSINFTGVLLDMLGEFGHRDVIEMYAEAVKQGKVELVGSAKYHAILPLLPEAEVRRQLDINDETSRKYFGDAYQRRGVFLPELAWDPKLAGTLEAAGFDWVLLDELAAGGHSGAVSHDQLYRLEGSKLGAVFRDRRLSATMGWAARSVERLKDAARQEMADSAYVVTATDGELFGHHQIGHAELLAQMYADPEVELALVSEVQYLPLPVEPVKTVACTWASSEDDIAKGIQFISWNDPGNEIHQLQWELLRLTVKEMGTMKADDPHYRELREQLDPALGSDQFYWSSARPWWMIEYIEHGAHDLVSILEQLPGVEPKIMSRGRDLYRQILSLAYEWQRSGKVDTDDKRARVPIKAQTLERGDAATWGAFMELMQREEAGAAAAGDYEEAILWRDGQYRLEHKLDMYDSIFIIDLLRTKLPKGAIEDAVEAHRQRYNQIRSGQVEQRSN